MIQPRRADPDDGPRAGGRLHPAHLRPATCATASFPTSSPKATARASTTTADATLWFFHALNRYLETTGDWETLRVLLPTLLDIVNHHLSGTRFGIGVDPADGLLRQGAEGYQLTWMDAKVGDWVVTPRRGKAVEINALWYNALRLLQSWVGQHGDPSMGRDVGP